MPDAASSPVRDRAEPASELAVDVAFTAARIPPVDVAIVVDVLRATSTIVQALAGGFRSVRCCGSLDAARSLRAPGRVLAAERDCLPVPGFGLGNSPVEIASRPGNSEELVLATTNGSPAVVWASRAVDRVLIGSLLNFRALIAAIPPVGRVGVVCSGTDGCPALEDTYVAGRIAERLGGELSDSARVAACVAAAYGDPMAPLAVGANARRLISSGQADDIGWCARESTVDLVPEARFAGPDEAIVTAKYI